jgi:hypothetical protein
MGSPNTILRETMFQYTQTRLFSSFSAPTSASSHTPTDPRADTRLPSPQETPSHPAQTPTAPRADLLLPFPLENTSHHAQTPSDLCTDPPLPIRLTTTSHHAQTPSDLCTDPPLPIRLTTTSHHAQTPSASVLTHLFPPSLRLYLTLNEVTWGVLISPTT